VLIINMIGNTNGLCASGETNWKFNFRWKLSRTVTDFLAPFYGLPVQLLSWVKAFSLLLYQCQLRPPVSLITHSWQNCNFYAFLNCLLFFCEQSCEMHRSPVVSVALICLNDLLAHTKIKTIHRWVTERYLESKIKVVT